MERFRNDCVNNCKHSPRKDSALCNNWHSHLNGKRYFVCAFCDQVISQPECVVSHRYVAFCNIIASVFTAVTILCVSLVWKYTVFERGLFAFSAGIAGFAFACVFIRIVDGAIRMLGQWSADSTNKDVLLQRQKDYTDVRRKKIRNAAQAALLTSGAFFSVRYMHLLMGFAAFLIMVRIVRNSKWFLLAIPVLFVVTMVLLIVAPSRIWIQTLPGICLSVWICCHDIVFDTAT